MTPGTSGTSGKTVCIIQARRRSTRLPDKVLEPIAGKTTMSHVVERCARIKGVDEVVAALVDDPYERPLHDEARAAGATVIAGDADNVLSRFARVVRQTGAQTILRVTADCPLLDPFLCSDLLTVYRQHMADFAVLGAWPHGMDCEVTSGKLLLLAEARADQTYHREHVTPWIRECRDLNKVYLQPHPYIDLRNPFRWVLDYPEDLTLLKAMAAALGTDMGTVDWLSLLNLMRVNPDLMDMNRAQSDHWRSVNKTLVRSIDETKRFAYEEVERPYHTCFWTDMHPEGKKRLLDLIAKMDL